MMYVVHFGLTPLLLGATILFERYGNMREGEALMCWLTLVLLPMLCLALPMRRPAIQRYATAYSLFVFGIIAVAIGYFAKRGASEQHEESRVRLLATPIEVEKYLASQMPTSFTRTEADDAIADRSAEPIFAVEFPLPEGIEPDVEKRLSANIHLSRKLLRLSLSDRDYEKARQPFEDALRREVSEKADRVVRNDRERIIAFGVLALGALALTVAAVLLAFRLFYFRRERIPQIEGRLP